MSSGTVEQARRLWFVAPSPKMEQQRCRMYPQMQQCSHQPTRPRGSFCLVSAARAALAIGVSRSAGPALLLDFAQSRYFQAFAFLSRCRPALWAQLWRCLTVFRSWLWLLWRRCLGLFSAPKPANVAEARLEVVFYRQNFSSVVKLILNPAIRNLTDCSMHSGQHPI